MALSFPSKQNVIIPMDNESNKLTINLIFWWYVLTFFAGIYIFYSGIDILLCSFGLLLPMSLEILLPGYWSVSVSVICIITGIFMMAASYKLALAENV